MTAVTAKSLYQTVATLGLTRAQVRRLLPSWWSPDMEVAQDGVAELGLHLARRLSLDVAALMEGRVLPKGAVSQVAFKHHANTAPDKLAASSYIASSLAQAVIAAIPVDYRPLPSDAAGVREEVRSQKLGVLGFDALLELCWQSGIPVIPLPHLPVGIQKMDGAALQVGGRPAIVIAKRKSSRAWLSFILAHEMAHVALGHLRSSSSTIIDVSLKDAATYATEASADTQEREADEFALQLLGGQEVENEIAQWSRRAAPVELAVSARTAGDQLGVEAGHLILRYAFGSKRWADAAIALRFLSEDCDAESALQSHLEARLDLSLVAEDLRDMVAQITGLTEQ